MQILSLIVTVFFLGSCSSSNKKVDQFILENPENFKMIQNLHYAEAGNPQNPMIVFVHGTPGSWDAWGDFLVNSELQKKYYLISVDRPGFGKSQPGKSVTELQKQSEIIGAVLKLKQNSQKVILVGHSYGGPVVMKMALDFPELVGGIVLVASPADPQLEKIVWYQRLANLAFSRWVLPTSINVCIDEIYPLKEELQKIEAQLTGLKSFVSVIHGGKDSLVPVKNVDYLKLKVPTHLLIDLKMNSDWNHFIPWNQSGQIIDSIDQLSKRLQ